MDCLKKIAETFNIENPGVTVIAQPEYEGVEIDGQVPADHAGRWETSIFWHLYPHLTRMDSFSMETKRKKIYDNPANDYYKTEEKWVWNDDLRETSSPELGEKCVEAMAEHISSLVVEALKRG